MVQSLEVELDLVLLLSWPLLLLPRLWDDLSFLLPLSFLFLDLVLLFSRELLLVEPEGFLDPFFFSSSLPLGEGKGSTFLKAMSNSLPSVKSWYGSSDASAGLVQLADLVSFASSSPIVSGSSGCSIFTVFTFLGWGSFFLGLAMRPRLGCFFCFSSMGEVGGSVSEVVSGLVWSCARYHWFSCAACSFSSTLGTRLVGFGFGETTLLALEVVPGSFLHGGRYHGALGGIQNGQGHVVQMPS